MSRIKFTVEDSKVSEVLKVLLNSEIDIQDWEVNGDESKDTIPTIHIHHPYYKEEKDTKWDPWSKKYIGIDPFYCKIKIGDEGFDYTGSISPTGSTAMPDNGYQYHSTTDGKMPTYKPTVTTYGVTNSDDYHQSSSDSIKMNSSTI